MGDPGESPDDVQARKKQKTGCATEMSPSSTGPPSLRLPEPDSPDRAKEPVTTEPGAQPLPRAHCCLTRLENSYRWLGLDDDARNPGKTGFAAHLKNILNAQRYTITGSGRGSDRYRTGLLILAACELLLHAWKSKKKVVIVFVGLSSPVVDWPASAATAVARVLREHLTEGEEKKLDHQPGKMIVTLGKSVFRATGYRKVQDLETKGPSALLVDHVDYMVADPDVRAALRRIGGSGTGTRWWATRTAGFAELAELTKGQETWMSKWFTE